MPGKTKAKGGKPCVVLPPPPSKKLLSKRAQIEKLLQENAPKPSPPLSKAKRPQQARGKPAISKTTANLYRKSVPYPFRRVADTDPSNVQTASVLNVDKCPCSVQLPPVDEKDRTGNSKAPRIGFLDLPGEVRNQIYNYLFMPDRFEIDFVSPKDRALTYNCPNHPGDNPKLRTYGVEKYRRSMDLYRRPKVNTHWLSLDPTRYRIGRISGPCALFLTCKTIAMEAPSIFYSKSIFSFKHNRSFKKFFEVISPHSIKHIRSLNLRHETAGEPLYQEFQYWKLKYDHSWEALCEDISEKLTGLENLSIDLSIYDDPFDTEEDAEWKWSLYAFKDLNLKRCRIRLRNAMADDAVLRVEEYKLQQAILGQNFSFGQTKKEKANRKAWLHLLDGTGTSGSGPRVLRFVQDGVGLRADSSGPRSFH